MGNIMVDDEGYFDDLPSSVTDPSDEQLDPSPCCPWHEENGEGDECLVKRGPEWMTQAEADAIAAQIQRDREMGRLPSPPCQCWECVKLQP